MKEITIGTKLPEPQFREFGIRAARRGLSKSGLLRALATEFIAGRDGTDFCPDRASGRHAVKAGECACGAKIGKGAA